MLMSATNEAVNISYNSLTKAKLQKLLTDRNVEWTNSMVKSELVTLAEGSE